jgi:hypothetical protein
VQGPELKPLYCQKKKKKVGAGAPFSIVPLMPLEILQVLVLLPVAAKAYLEYES